MGENEQFINELIALMKKHEVVVRLCEDYDAEDLFYGHGEYVSLSEIEEAYEKAK